MNPIPSPAQTQAILNEALAFHRAGQTGPATALYRRLLKVQPRNADVLWLLGSLECQLGNLERGAALLGRLLKVDPDHAYAHYNLGLALSKLDRWEEAVSSYDRALAIKPDYAEAHINRGTALRDLHRPEEALASYDRALAVKPDYAEAYYNRGLALSQLERQVDALASYDRALAIKPDYAEAYCHRGLTLNQLDRRREALASYDNALAVKPDYADAHGQRGNLLFMIKRFEEALTSYDKVLAIKPNHDCVLGQHAHVRMLLCDWRAFHTERDQLVEKIWKNQGVSSPFPILALIDSPEVHRRASEIYVSLKYPTGHDLPEPAKNKKNGKIRIGYLSADFHNHPMMHLMAEMFASHDRNRFEIIAFSLGPDAGDIWRKRVAPAFDEFIDVRAMPDQEVAALARKSEIDIAIDLNGFTQGCRTGILAQRAAPVQVNYLGYPGTMGASYVDYLIADHTLIPEDARQYYCEKIVYLPNCYQANCRERDVSDKKINRLDLGLPASGFVFCSFNTNYKITPDVFDSWMQIIARVPDSVLWLLVSNPTARLNLRNSAEHRGIDPNRLIFAATMPVEEHLSRLRSANLFLDTFPYNAHTTASDALRMGLPIVTRMGQSFASRVAASLLRVVGLPELITTTPEEYATLAVHLATHPDALESVRQKLLDNLPTCALFDTQRFTRNIESAYVAMYERCQNDLPPDHIVVT